MKHSRLLILTVLLFAALVAAVVPVFAAEPFGSAINASFEFDTDGDGTPNNWHKHGDNIIHVCGRPSDHMLDDCLMAFLPDDDRAALIQIYENGLPETTGEDVEGWLTLVMEQYSAAVNLDSNRIYAGWRACWEEYDYCLTYYGPVRGGSYNFNYQAIWGSTENAEAFGVLLAIGGEPMSYFAWGWMALPGSGQAYIDAAFPQWVIFIP